MPLIETARIYWRHYLPAWLFFPAVFFAARYFDFPVAIFWIVFAPLYFVVSIWAMLPWLRRKAGYWPSLVWAVLVPVSIWFLAVAFAPSAGAA